jgi:fatty-acyl-CoA synthase/long-chain acyl-CoA synthetase
MSIPVQCGSHVTYEIRETCVGAALDEAATRWPDRAGWTFDDLTVTFAEMRERTDRVARALLACGIAHGDVVAVWSPNAAEAVYLEFGCAKIGAVVTHLNTRFKSFEIEYILQHSDARLLVMVDRFLKIDFNAILAEICPEEARDPQGRVSASRLPHLRRIVSLDKPAFARSLAWEAFVALGDSIAPGKLKETEQRARWDEPMLLQYTSGTTARPKGALLDHRYVMYASLERLVRAGLDEDGVFLNTQPYYHIGGSGILTVPLTLGCEVVSTAYYDVERVLGLIERKRCTIRSGQSAMYLMELEHPRFRSYDLSSLKGGWCIGPPALMQRVRDEMRLPHVVQIYGMTEGGGTGGFRDEPWRLRATTCGRALTGVELAIIDPDTGRRQPAGQPGEICSRGWMQMKGYLKQPDETRRAIDDDGWLHSGDRGVINDAGYLAFIGRIKDMLRIGGENVSSEEVESVLLTHPHIVQAAVIGYPDRRLGEVVLAVVEPRLDTELSEDDVIRYCAGRMANFRVPRQVRITHSWPMTGSGKIRKNVLRELYVKT